VSVVLEGRGLRKRLGGVQVLTGLNVTLEEGRLLGLIGPNGAGKTTCLRILTGLLKADAGEVWFDGVQWPSQRGLAWRARKGLGYLPQHPSVFRALSVWENLRAVPGSTQDMCEAVLEEIGLQGLATRWARDLSGGERRRLELGRLMLMPLRVLVCDEPFAALDPQGIAAVGGLLRKICQGGGAVLVTDHQLEALLGLCDDVALLIDGHIARQGPAAEMRRDPMVRTRYLGTT